MTRSTIAAAGLALALSMLPATASAQAERGFVQGFGGFTFGDPSLQPTFGGKVATNLTPNIQLVGDIGYMHDVLPSELDLVLALVPVDIRSSAFVAEGGVRVIARRGSPVRGCGEVLAGAARLSTAVDLGFGGGLVAGLVDNVLNAFDRTEPVVTFGTGVVFQGDALFVDVGYRYTRIFADPFGLVLGDTGLDVSQLRVGVGLSF